MARPGAYIRDIQLLEELNNKIVSSGEMMSNIDVGVSNYINGVKDSLERDLNTIQMKLNEAEARLTEAETALSVCQASQAMALAAGVPGPSCMMEESAVEAARMEVEKWQMRHGQGQRILGECQQEIGEYNGLGGGHSLILAMSEQQTPKASQLLCGCIEKLQDVLASPMAGDLNMGENDSLKEIDGVHHDDESARDLKKLFKL